MRRQSQRTKGVGRAALFVPLAAALAALAAGCASARPASTGAARNAAHLHSMAGGVADMPLTTYLRVVQNYDVPAKNGGPGQWRYSVTDGRTIAELTGLINALPKSPNQGITPCPSSLAPSFELDFADGRGGRTVAQVGLECFGVMVDMGERRLPILASASPGGKSLLQQVEALLTPYMPKS